MSKIEVIAKLFSVLPIVASDISRATEDKYISGREIFKTIEDFLITTSLGEKISIKIGGGKEEITLLEVVKGIEKFLDTIIGLDKIGFELSKDSFKFVIKTSPGSKQ
jgi:hypothetical protein